MGEATTNGERPGIVTKALPFPLPTRAPAQRLRASVGVVPSSFVIVQTGRPLVSTVPFLSRRKSSVCRIGGADLSRVPTRVTLLRKTGALPRAGSSRGCTVAVALTQTDPTSAVSAEAVAQTPTASSAAKTAILRNGLLNHFPLQRLNTEPCKKVPSLNLNWPFACKRPSGQPALAKLRGLPLYFHSRSTLIRAYSGIPAPPAIFGIFATVLKP